MRTHRIPENDKEFYLRAVENENPSLREYSPQTADTFQVVVKTSIGITSIRTNYNLCEYYCVVQIISSMLIMIFPLGKPQKKKFRLPLSSRGEGTVIKKNKKKIAASLYPWIFLNACIRIAVCMLYIRENRLVSVPKMLPYLSTPGTPPPLWYLGR